MPALAELVREDRDLADLEEIAGRLAMFGRVTTNVAFCSPVSDRALPPSAAEENLALAG